MKRHKPSVIYIPGIDTWYHTLSEAQITTFLGLLKAIPPTDPVLVLGITDAPPDKVSADMLRDLFGYSRKNRFTIERPNRVSPPFQASVFSLTFSLLVRPRTVLWYYHRICPENTKGISRAFESQEAEVGSPKDCTTASHEAAYERRNQGSEEKRSPTAQLVESSDTTNHGPDQKEVQEI